MATIKLPDALGMWGGAVSKIIKGEEINAFDMPPKVISTTSNKTISEDGVYELEEGLTGTLTITATKVKLIGSPDITYENLKLNVTANDNAILQIKNLHIHHSSNYGTVIGFPKTTTGNKLILEGDNAITGVDASWNNYSDNAPVYIGGGLEITGTGTLDCSGHSQNSSAFIGTNFNEQLGSNITISGSAKISNANIGAGHQANIGNIYVCENASINGGSTNGTSSTCGKIYIYGNASVSGSHIGCGDTWYTVTSSCGDIVIGGNANVSIESSTYKAAIGGARAAYCSNIYIGDNARVYASSSYNGCAGIGSGNINGNYSAGCGDIIIGGNATVTALSTDGGAAIGTSKGGSNSTSWCRNIIIGGNASVSASATISRVPSGWSAPENIGRALYQSSYGKSSYSSRVLGKNATVNGSACTTSGYEDINFDVISNNI